jgi:hypothetical protein
MKYQVIVGNIGTVLDTNDRHEVDSVFETYKAQSESGVGRAGGESVTIMEDGEPVKEHVGSNDNND